MTVDVLIVTFNSAETIEACVSALPTVVAGHQLLVHVWDNDSSDATVELVRQRPAVRLHESTENIGFAAACNALLCESEGDVVCLVNPDVEVRPGTLEALAEAVLSDPTVGLASARLERPDGTLQVEGARPRPRLHRIAAGHAGGNALLGRLRGDVPLYADQDVECSVGALLVARRDVVDEVDGLDESAFMYLEDIELCHQVRARGRRIRYYGTLAASHVGGHSRAGREDVLDTLGPLVWVSYFSRYGCRAERLLARPALAFAYALRALLSVGLLRHRQARLAAGNALRCLLVSVPPRKGLSNRRLTA